MSHDHDPYRSAVIAMPSSAQLGGPEPMPFVRFPFFPTAPWYSTNPNVGYQVRYYSTGILSSDADFQIGSSPFGRSSSTCLAVSSPSTAPLSASKTLRMHGSTSRT